MIEFIVFLLIISAIVSTLWDLKLLQRFWKWMQI